MLATKVNLSADRAWAYFALAAIAFIPLAIFAPWAAPIVVGYAYATPIRRHPKLLAAVWVIGGVITAYFLLLVIGLLFPTTHLDVGPVHRAG